MTGGGAQADAQDSHYSFDPPSTRTVSPRPARDQLAVCPPSTLRM
jgi:hypothetical protein